MKQVFIKSVLIGFFTMFLALASCAKKSSSTQNRTGTAPRGDAGTAATTTLGLAVNKCADGVTSSAGRLIDESATGNAFRNSWVDFFSAVMAPEFLGDLSGLPSSSTTGVNIEIKMKVANNQIVREETKLALIVNDGFVGKTNEGNGEIYNSIKINFASAESATYSNGQYTLVFADAYGKITVNGTYTQTTTTGTVTFVNSKHYSNETPKSGTLGKYSFNSCGLFL